jgi:hypothetical protein
VLCLYHCLKKWLWPVIFIFMLGNWGGLPHPGETMRPMIAGDPIGEVSYSNTKEKTPREGTGVSRAPSVAEKQCTQWLGNNHCLSSQTDGSNPSPLLLFVGFGQITPLFPHL